MTLTGTHLQTCKPGSEPGALGSARRSLSTASSPAAQSRRRCTTARSTNSSLQTRSACAGSCPKHASTVLAGWSGHMYWHTRVRVGVSGQSCLTSKNADQAPGSVKGNWLRPAHMNGSAAVAVTCFVTWFCSAQSAVTCFIGSLQQCLTDLLVGVFMSSSDQPAMSAVPAVCAGLSQEF